MRAINFATEVVSLDAIQLKGESNTHIHGEYNKQF